MAPLRGAQLRSMLLHSSPLLAASRSLRGAHSAASSDVPNSRQLLKNNLDDLDRLLDQCSSNSSCDTPSECDPAAKALNGTMEDVAVETSSCGNTVRWINKMLGVKGVELTLSSGKKYNLTVPASEALKPRSQAAELGDTGPVLNLPQNMQTESGKEVMRAASRSALDEFFEELRKPDEPDAPPRIFYPFLEWSPYTAGQKFGNIDRNHIWTIIKQGNQFRMFQGYLKTPKVEELGVEADPGYNLDQWLKSNNPFAKPFGGEGLGELETTLRTLVDNSGRHGFDSGKLESIFGVKDPVMDALQKRGTATDYSVYFTFAPVTDTNLPSEESQPVPA